MALYSYIVTHDTGFAPNPFWGFCTLACCKPKIRNSAREGDWIVGLTPRARGNHLVYVMRVQEVLSFGEYFRDRRFRPKRPRLSTDDLRYRCGDNIYEPHGGSSYRQLRSMHSRGEEEDLAAMAHDLGGRNVLVSDRFWYFGAHALQLPAEFRQVITGRGHRKFESDELISEFERFLRAMRTGLHGPPHRWPKDNRSWVEGGSCTSC